MTKRLLWTRILVVVFVLANLTNGIPSALATEGEQKVVTFVNWASVEEATQPNILAIIEAFEKENPDIKIDNQGIAVSDIVKELTIMCTAGNAPDVAQLVSDNVRQLQASNFLHPLDGLFSEEFVAQLYPDLYDACGLVDGQHYASPWANSTHGLFYNRKLMEEAGFDPNKPPTTIDELTEMMRIAKEKLPDDVIMLQADTTVRTIGLIHQWPLMLAFNEGVEPYNLAGEVNMNTEGMKAYMEWMRMLVNDGLVPPGLKYGEFRPYAAQNKLLFGNDWTCFDGIVRSLDANITPEIMYETWGATNLPAGKDGIPRTPVQAHSLVIFKDSDVSEEAAKFVEFMVANKVGVEEYIASNGFTPVTVNALEVVPSLANSPFITGFSSDVIPTSVPMPTGPDYAMYAEIIMVAVQEVITTDNAIEPILANAQKKLEALF